MDITYSKYEEKGELQILTARKEVRKLGGSGYASLPKEIVGKSVLIIYARRPADLPKIFDDLKKKLHAELNPVDNKAGDARIKSKVKKHG